MTWLTTEFHAVLQSWSGTSFEIHSAYTTVEEAENALRTIKCNILNVAPEIDDDTLDEKWVARSYNGCDQEEYDLVSWMPEESDQLELPINEANLKTINVLWLWEKLGDIPIDGNECIEIRWFDFPVGTHREEIWHWFEEQFNIPVHALMYPSEHPEIWEGR